MLLVFIIAVATLTISIISLILAIILFIQLLILKAPYVKTPQRVIEKILNEIKISPNDVVYDLGCGDASFLIAVDKKIGAKTIGFDLSPIAYYRAKQRIATEHAKTKVYFQNFFKQNLSDATMVFCFLVPALMKKVGDHLQKQLQPGARVISYAFPIPQWQPSKIIDTLPNGDPASKIYIYQY